MFASERRRSPAEAEAAALRRVARMLSALSGALPEEGAVDAATVQLALATVESLALSEAERLEVANG